MTTRFNVLFSRASPEQPFVAGSGQRSMQNLALLCRSLIAGASGVGASSVEFQSSAVAASGTLTFNGTTTGTTDTVINGVTVTSNITPYTDGDLAQRFVDAFNADIDVSGIVTCSRGGEGPYTCDIVANTAGAAGNSIGLSVTAGDATRSAATLTGGDDAFQAIGSLDFTGVVGGNPGAIIGGITVTVPFNTSPTQTMTDWIAAATAPMAAKATFTNNLDGTCVITAVPIGTLGNAVTLVASGAGVTVSGATIGAGTGTPGVDAVAATGSFTFNGNTGGTWTLGIGGFDVSLSSTDDATSAADCAAAINAETDPLVAGFVTASSASNVVTVTAIVPGTSGNAVTLSNATSGVTVSGARLEGGDSTNETFSF